MANIRKAESPKLILCKHCGSTATRMKDDRFWWVECDSCGMHTPASNFCNPDEVWNRTAPIRCGECDQEIEGSHYCFVCVQVMKEKLVTAE